HGLREHHGRRAGGGRPPHQRRDGGPAPPDGRRQFRGRGQSPAWGGGGACRAGVAFFGEHTRPLRPADSTRLWLPGHPLPRPLRPRPQTRRRRAPPPPTASRTSIPSLVRSRTTVDRPRPMLLAPVARPWIERPVFWRPISAA